MAQSGPGYLLRADCAGQVDEATSLHVHGVTAWPVIVVRYTSCHPAIPTPTPFPTTMCSLDVNTHYIFSIFARGYKKGTRQCATQQPRHNGATSATR